jgi:carboxyl-terminal processing protease
LPKKALKITGITLLCVFVAVCIFAGGIFVGEKTTLSKYLLNHVPVSTSASSDLKILDEVYGIVVNQYVESPNKNKILTGAIDGLLAALDDPYTRHFAKKDFQHVEEVTEGRFEGVGMTMEDVSGQLTVVAPIEGTPAATAGIKAGDKVMAIDGKETKGMPLDTAVAKIKGKSGTKVVLTIARDGVANFVVSLTRTEIRIPNIQAHMEGDVGYVRLIHSFDSTAGADIRKEMKSLKGQGAKAIILDLRNNPGGLLYSGVDVASSFIDKGVIVSIKEKKAAERKYTAMGNSDPTIPVVILVNKGSASASEIVAGAIQDYERGPIVGEQTFGKGSVQTVMNLTDGSGLIITTAKYYTPKGRSISKIGVTPDIKIAQPDGEATDVQLAKAIEVLHFMISGGDWKTLKN